jgi:cardiolipin synthase
VNLPNLISLARLLAVPLIVWLMVIGEWRFAFLTFCVAGVSDAVDGFLAKRFNAQSELGRYLDPLADKSLIVAIYVTLGIQGQLPAWLVILVVSRDLLIVGGSMLLYALNLRYTPNPLISSKINTASQIALAAVVLSVLAFDLAHVAVGVDVLVAVTALTTVVSGVDYLFDWGRRFNEGEQESK